jgi:xylulokinase
LSLGVVSSQHIAITIGTAAQVFVPTNKPVIDKQGRLHTLCHCVPDTWHVMGAHLNGGLCLSWVAAMWPETSIETLLYEAAQVPANSAGLIFLPYLQGERTPHFDANVRGVFLGLSTTHGRAHLVRSVLEGVGFALCDSWRLLHTLSMGATTKLSHELLTGPQVFLTGGATRSQLWTQILADVLGQPMQIAETHGSAYGAAMLAGWGSRLWTDPLRYAAQPQRLIMPSNNISQYLDGYERFCRVYSAVRGLF